MNHFNRQRWEWVVSQSCLSQENTSVGYSLAVNILYLINSSDKLQTPWKVALIIILIQEQTRQVFFFNSGRTKQSIEIEHKQSWDLQFIFLVYWEIGPS